MFLSAARSLSWLASWAPRDLVDHGALVGVSGRAGRVAHCSGLSFELHLGPEWPCRRVDVVVALLPKWGGLQLAQTRGSGDGPSWARVRALCEAWTAAGSRALGPVPAVGVEFDGEVDATAAALDPYPTVCVQPAFYQGAVGEGAGERGAELLERVWAVAGHLGRGLPSDAVRRAIERSIEAIPQGGALVHVAPARSGTGLRLVVACPQASVASYLDHAGWPGPAERLSGILSITSTGAYAELYLEVGETLMGALGVGSPSFGPHHRHAVGRVLDALAREAQLEAAPLRHAERWIGEETLVVPGAIWPSRITRALCAKLVLRPTQAPLAKLYLEAYATLDLTVGPNGSSSEASGRRPVIEGKP